MKKNLTVDSYLVFFVGLFFWEKWLGKEFHTVTKSNCMVNIFFDTTEYLILIFNNLKLLYPEHYLPNLSS